MTDLIVDTDAIHLLTHRLRRAAAELTPEHEVLSVPQEAFESPVAAALVASNIQLGRQCDAVAAFVTSLADAGERVAATIVEADASLGAPTSSASALGRNGGG